MNVNISPQRKNEEPSSHAGFHEEDSDEKEVDKFFCFSLDLTQPVFLTQLFLEPTVATETAGIQFSKSFKCKLYKRLINTNAGSVLVEVLFEMSGAGCSVSGHLPDTCPEEKCASWQHSYQHGPVYEGNTKPVAQ